MQSDQVKVAGVGINTRHPAKVSTILVMSVENNDNTNQYQWDYDSRCCSTIRTAKKDYNRAKRSAAAAAASAENERNTRSCWTVVSESSPLSDSSSTTTEQSSPPMTTDDDR